MISEQMVEHYVKRIKKKAKWNIEKCNYNSALELIAIAANLLYVTNIYYADKELEEFLKIISEQIVTAQDEVEYDNNILLFWDGFGVNSRGLTQIYLKALCKYKKVIYVTFSNRKDKIPDIKKIVNDKQGKVVYIEGKKKVDEIKQFQEIIRKYAPKHFFFYSFPEDVVGTTILNGYENKIIRYQINLTDHAFWLGANCIDKCIEFREYGANISWEYRKIDEKKIEYIPFYPVIDKTVPFGGYPFPFDETKQKLIFSGGSLYKTMDDSNYYYEIVEYILSKYNDSVFWYAGTGDDSKLSKIISKYPNRAYYTPERSDLFQIMRKCFFYLNTYPIGGGLMMQYAAIAGKIPLTLESEKVGNAVKGVLVDQETLEIEYKTINDIEREIDLLFSNQEYIDNKSARMQNSVIAEKRFEEDVLRLLNGEKLNKNFQIKHENTEGFRKGYLWRQNKNTFYELFLKSRLTGFINFPLVYLWGAIYRIINVTKKKLVKLFLYCR